MQLTQDKLDELSHFSLRLAHWSEENWKAKGFAFFSDVELIQSIDAFSSVGFSAPFSPERSDFRQAFRPLAYSPVSVLLGGHQLQLTGRIVDVETELSPSERRVVVKANSLPSALCDCTAGSVLKKKRGSLEFIGLKLEDIANELCAPLGFNARFADERSTFIDINGDGTLERDRSANRVEQGRIEGAFAAKFGKVRLKPEDKIFDFLTTLAKQRGVLLVDSPTGDLVFQRPAATGRPVVHLEEGVAPLLSIKPTFSPSEYFSEVTVIVPARQGREACTFTLKNPFLTMDGVVRPTTYKAEDSDVGSAPQIAHDVMSRMFGNVASWEIDLPTFVDPSGEYYRPNTTITVRAPSAMIYGKHELLIRQVTKRQTKDAVSCTLTAVLPTSFTGQLPARLPWQEAL